MHHHRGGGGHLTSHPPPNISRSSRGSGPGGRALARSRSRSRSRSPPSRGGGSGRYRNERDSRDTRERDRDRDRSRRSVSPYRSNSRNERDRDRERRTEPSSSKASASASQDSVPSISLIQPDGPPQIIRRILNPDDVKIPRRVNEGSKPIFERDELKEAMRRRMLANDNEENPSRSNPYVQDVPVNQQRVVAIIREPVGADMYPNYSSAAAAASSSASREAATSSGTGRTVRSLQDSARPSSSATYGHGHSSRRSPSPKDIRRRAASPPPSSSARGRSRSLEREKDRDRMLLLDRERDRGMLRLVSERDREPARPPPPGPGPRDRGDIRDLRDLVLARPVGAASGSGGGRNERDHRRGSDIRDEIEREREREKGRFSGPSSSQPLSRRSRSPISRVLREDVRLRRRSRSHSVTPPPMPEGFRREIIERQRNVDLRSSLSRQPDKFGTDDRLKGHPMGGGGSFRGSGRGGGRGGRFNTRPGRGREDERRVWVHDMYEDDQPKKLN